MKMNDSFLFTALIIYINCKSQLLLSHTRNNHENILLHLLVLDEQGLK